MENQSASNYRIPQMHKEVVSCFRQWQGRDVQIRGALLNLRLLPE